MKDKKKPTHSKAGKQVSGTVGKVYPAHQNIGVGVLGDTSPPVPDKGKRAGTPGKPEELIEWRNNLKKREDMLKYLKTAERYWYSKDWFGSEKRQTPA